MFSVRSASLGAVLVLPLLACSAMRGNNQDHIDLRPLVSAEGLELVPDGPFKYEYAKAGADLGSYNKLLLEPVVLAYTKGAHHGLIDQQQLDRMRRYFREAVEKKVGATHPIVTKPGSDVLRLKASVVNLRFTDIRSRMDAANREMTGSPMLHYVMIPDIKLIVELQDSESHETLYRLGDDEFLNIYEDTTTYEVRFWSDMERGFDAWAVKLHEMLEHAVPSRS